MLFDDAGKPADYRFVEVNRSATRYVVMTGHSQGTADEPAMAAAPCIQKPWNSAELLLQLRQLVGQGLSPARPALLRRCRPARRPRRCRWCRR